MGLYNTPKRFADLEKAIEADVANRAEAARAEIDFALIGIRFLADFLAGDAYFKVHRDGHNLDRCRTQFKLVESIEAQEEAMNRLVESC